MKEKETERESEREREEENIREVMKFWQYYIKKETILKLYRERSEKRDRREGIRLHQ